MKSIIGFGPSLDLSFSLALAHIQRRLEFKTRLYFKSGVFKSFYQRYIGLDTKRRPAQDDGGRRPDQNSREICELHEGVQRNMPHETRRPRAQMRDGTPAQWSDRVKDGRGTVHAFSGERGTSASCHFN
ncbi:hypothetical protein C8R45DRAFT_947837 [Mycena sanguinolenta]|nr:hypothetical protein C8R45DRAFT_947837 [Mycena sanguinolenta]